MGTVGCTKHKAEASLALILLCHTSALSKRLETWVLLSLCYTWAYCMAAEVHVAALPLFAVAPFFQAKEKVNKKLKLVYSN